MVTTTALSALLSLPKSRPRIAYLRQKRVLFLPQLDKVVPLLRRTQFPADLLGILSVCHSQRGIDQLNNDLNVSPKSKNPRGQVCLNRPSG